MLTTGIPVKESAASFLLFPLSKNFTCRELAMVYALSCCFDMYKLFKGHAFLILIRIHNQMHVYSTSCMLRATQNQSVVLTVA